ncbi:hypothetical protein ACJX0J_039479 [Zea mays]
MNGPTIKQANNLYCFQILYREREREREYHMYDVSQLFDPVSMLLDTLVWDSCTFLFFVVVLACVTTTRYSDRRQVEPYTHCVDLIYLESLELYTFFIFLSSCYISLFMMNIKISYYYYYYYYYYSYAITIYSMCLHNSLLENHVSNFILNEFHWCHNNKHILKKTDALSIIKKNTCTHFIF